MVVITNKYRRIVAGTGAVAFTGTFVPLLPWMNMPASVGGTVVWVMIVGGLVHYACSANPARTWFGKGLAGVDPFFRATTHSVSTAAFVLHLAGLLFALAGASFITLTLTGALKPFYDWLLRDV